MKTLSRSLDNNDIGNASLDRIDSNLGYIVGNVGWTSTIINIMKQNLKLCDFIELCCIISKNKSIG